MIVDQSEYNKLVIYHFEKKREERTLSLLLANPTRSSIRRACVNRYNERDSERDHILLRDFFGPAEPGRQRLQLIEGFNVERFRTLNNYLRKESGSTDNLNIELLAWLIDFKHRPFSEDNNLELSEDESAILDKEDPTAADPPASQKAVDKVENGTGAVSLGTAQQNGIESTPISTGEENNAANTVTGNQGSNEPPVKVEPGSEKIIVPVAAKRKQWKKVAAVITTLVISGASLFLFNKEKKTGPDPLGSSLVCMYWNGDQYEEAPCSKAGIVKMEKEKIRTFRRIRDEKTITEEAIGKVHYIKDGEIKYYTEAGRYPDDTSRTLKKLTRYMFDKYLKKKDTTRENDLARQP